jgi:uncharacterized protein (TIGR02453 family)
MKTVAIKNSTLKFLSDIAENNNRDWFQTEQDFYLKAQENMHSFIDTLILELNKHDQLEIRSAKPSPHLQRHEFSKDKLPYHAKFDFGLKRSGKQRRGGYYMNIKLETAIWPVAFFPPNQKI